ncbi:CHRD domain-containing protein [Sabulibacter ruber]|uniref:CHRD domain-containing protein n=1 Tax=Sabulibacter ruber TaxID=2811901 RepID=UPI001A95CCD5|nr:CHRD domain-containing protein [Sabulibacter ruber]
MKTQNLFTRFVLGLLFMLPFVMVSCGDDDEDDQPSNIVQFQNISITGPQETPPNNSTATGTFSGSYNRDTKILTYTITFTGISPTNMHFHKAPVGEPGPVVIPIGSAPYTSPINAQTPALTADQEADLLNGLWYVNIHSAAFPPGEIRGQVVRQQ